MAKQQLVKSIKSAHKKLEQAKNKDFWLRLFSFGFLNNKNEIHNAQIIYKSCVQQSDTYNSLIEKNELIDKQLNDLKDFDGSRISSINIPTQNVLNKEDYGEDWISIRNNVLERDNFECQEFNAYCSDTLHVHHIIPLSKGGTNAIDNLITLCEYHHSLKHPHMRK